MGRIAGLDILDNIGKSIRLFMVDGSPQGILTLEVINWTGHILMGPRTKIVELVQRPEMARTGLYFLTGPDPDGSLRPYVYIGESDQVGKRIIQHNKDESKEWEKVCVVTSKDQNLTKAHVRFLESHLIQISHEIGHAKIFNSTMPKYEYLPEADIADMKYFIEQIRLILPILGLDFLREKPKITKIKEASSASQIFPNILSSDIEDSPIFEIQNRKDKLEAFAKETSGDFIVLAGSKTRTEWKTSGHNYQKLFESLIAERKIKIDPSENVGIMQEDIVFSSPSAAAAIIFGRAANGRFEWKLKGTSLTYGEWQNEKLIRTVPINLTLEDLNL